MDKNVAIKVGCALLAMAAMGATSARAAWITGVSIVDATGSDQGRDVGRTIDGSGLTTTGPTSGTVSADSDTLYQSAGGTPFIVFDLGAVYTLQDITIWNGNADLDRNVQDITFSFSNTYTTSDPANFSSTQAFTIPQAPGNSSYAGYLATLSPQVSGKFVRLQVLDGYNNGNNRNLAEIRFNAVTPPAVPEPASLGLLGLGSLLMLRRRKIA